MKVLALDIGAGTQEILYDDRRIKNGDINVIC